MYDYLNHIQRQLEQRNIKPKLQQFRYLLIQPGEIYYELKAYNELLFLIKPDQLPIGTRIVSESRARVIPSDVTQIQGIEDYSGLVSIKLPVAPTEQKTIEFIQITL
jgi:hypothetical protein